MLNDHRPRRSALYLPASNPRALAKAPTLPADMVILDLEDAVAPDAKVSARTAAVEASREPFGASEVLIRCNALDTPWGEEDVRAVTRGGAAGLVAPKVNSAADVDAYDRLLDAAGAPLALWVMIESCRGVLALEAIASRAASTRLAGMIVGTNDLAREMRARPTADRAAVVSLLTQTVVAARAFDLVVLDGVCNEFNDMEAFAVECHQARLLGFDGKSLIHPRQIDPCNAIFAPSQAEAAWAEAVVAAFDRPENADKGALNLDGAMVERLHLHDAHRILAMARRIDETV